jgi:hypothetical protein
MRYVAAHGVPPAATHVAGTEVSLGGSGRIMSDLSISLEALERSRFQLPVSSYFDEELFRREQALIFQQSPRYLGHELAVPQIGDHLALAQEGEGRALVRTRRAWSWSPTCAATARP